jgi:hypothetical protein
MTIDERMARLERRAEELYRRQERIFEEQAGIRARLGSEHGLAPMDEVEIRELARDIHAHGWPGRGV